MVSSDKMPAAIKAIHMLILEARFMTGSIDFDKEKLFSLLDNLEYLPALLIEEEDNSILFETCLFEICNIYNLDHIVRVYKTMLEPE